MARSPKALLQVEEKSSTAKGFSLSLSNFEGPFDLLLSLISKHEVDITDIALSAVTDEFISYLRNLDSEEELDRASEFLVVAATLLDLKIVGLLPQGELVDAEDVALLEARDMLRRIEAAIGELPDRTREIFMAHRFEDLTYPEIARSMGISVKTVEKHISLALRELHRCVGVGS